MYRQISHSGYANEYNFHWSQTMGFIPKETLDWFDQLCKDSKENEIKDNSTIYSSPMSNYPAYKLKNFIEENKMNVSKARKWDKIDTIILDEEFLSSLKNDEEKTYHIIPVEEIKANKERYTDKANKYYRDNIDKYLKDTKYFFVDEEELIHKSFRHFKPFPTIKGIPIGDYHGLKKINNNLDFIKELKHNIEKYNLHVVLDSSINKLANKDTVIDLDTYEILYGMLRSMDDGNWGLAREIIANCEYDSSRPYILFLASHFDILWNKSSNTNYHAVHKRLLKEKIRQNRDRIHMVKCILNENPEYKPIIAQCLKTHLNSLYQTDLIKEIVSY